MELENKGPRPAWYDIVVSARPILLTTIELLIHTKRFGPYGNALRLLSVAIDHVVPADPDSGLFAAIRKTQRDLDDLDNAAPSERQEVLTLLHSQVSELEQQTELPNNTIPGGIYEQETEQQQCAHCGGIA